MKARIKSAGKSYFYINILSKERNVSCYLFFFNTDIIEYSSFFIDQ